jgi:hypothetical protein
VLGPSQDQPAGVEKERRGGRHVSGLLFTGTSATRACGAIGTQQSGAIVVFKLNAPTSAPVEAANFAALGYRERFTVRWKHCYTRTASILRECDTAHTSLLTLSLKSRQGKKECRVGIRETRH